MRRSRSAAAVALLACALPGIAIAFPGSDPNESVRANPPNDPEYDRCEPDHAGGPTCSNVYDEDWQRYGFAPAASQYTATYQDSGASARQRAQNAIAGRNVRGQVSGISADRAWKYSIGDPSIQIAIEDTGIRWDRTQLRAKIGLNAAELPTPLKGAATCAADDCNGDGAFNVDDYADDPRVTKDVGVEEEADKLLDAGDLIAVFSDRRDDDRNGYVDDIAGWDFFDDDNNPYDASSYSSANNHGSGRATEAAGATDDGAGGTGVCPRCQIVPLRVWDTFVAPTDHFAMAAVYAADNGIEIVESALGGLSSTRFVRNAMRYAYRRGVFFAVVSSDLNTADHNIPTIYNEALQVQGVVPDTNGLGQDAAELGPLLGRLGISSAAPLQTWFRNSGTTQYGGHAHVVMPATTGSEATGQAAGAAGLVASFGRQKGVRLAANEIKQLLTLTAEDVVAENTGGLGTPDPAQPGWDQHFGYGRVDLGHALQQIQTGQIPPQALITSPDWFAPLNLERRDSVRIGGRVSAPRARSFSYELQWAPGIEPLENDFRRVVDRGSRKTIDGVLGTIDLRAVRRALDRRPGGGATRDPTAPNQPAADVDPNEPAFTVRVLVTDDQGVRGEDRKVLFAYRDDTLLRGWAKRIGAGGEASQRLFDVDGDNALDVVLPDSSGLLHVLDWRGRNLRSFNRGRPVKTRLLPNVHKKARVYRHVDPPRETLRTPAIGDIDGDREPEIVDTAGERLYAWHLNGKRVRHFPRRVNPAYSAPALRTRLNHVKRGFIASPTLGDLIPGGGLEIVAPALDQYVYAWDGRGRTVPGFPVLLKDGDLVGAEIINTAALGDIAGDSRPEIVVPTTEVDDSMAAGGNGDLSGSLRQAVVNVLSGAIGGSARIYALDAAGKVMPGWPLRENSALPDALPLVSPGVDQVLGDVDADGRLDRIGNVALGSVHATGGDGAAKTEFATIPVGGEHIDKAQVLNLFENPIVANLDGDPGLEVIKGGLTLNGLVNLGVLTGQNLPYNHVVQAWDAETGDELRKWPQAVEDYQLLSSPAVADVAGTAGNEVVVGTGLYLLRAISAGGGESHDFPKFTGGWLFSVPTIGDADGDGKLDIATITREGYAFLWRTSRPACASNDEWWTSRHDEWNTGAYGTDTRPPGSARLVKVARSGATLRVQWRAPGDDWLCGTSDRYEVRVSSRPIRSPGAGRRVAQGRGAKVDSPEALTLRGRAAARARYVAIVYADEAGNWGRPATVRVPRP